MNPLQRLSTVGVRSVPSAAARKQRTQQITSVRDRQAVHSTIRVGREAYALRTQAWGLDPELGCGNGGVARAWRRRADLRRRLRCCIRASCAGAGEKIVMPMTDMFFGSREGRISDPFGNMWTIATLKEAVAPEEMQQRMKAEGY
jgi:hypothetical protein